MQHLKKAEAVKERGYSLHAEENTSNASKEWNEPWQPSNKSFPALPPVFRRQGRALLRVPLPPHDVDGPRSRSSGSPSRFRCSSTGGSRRRERALRARRAGVGPICLNEFRRMQEASEAAEWGMTQFEDEEVDRPGLHAEPSPTMKYFAFSYKVKGKCGWCTTRGTATSPTSAPRTSSSACAWCCSSSRSSAASSTARSRCRARGRTCSGGGPRRRHPAAQRGVEPYRQVARRPRELPHRDRVRGRADRVPLRLPVRQLVRLALLHRVHPALRLSRAVLTTARA